jgi:(1->4)-alpha-D-glucan 1-alpha-D-glucosylmutase
VTPTATYRLQFGPNLRFHEAAEAVPYLASLGVSHVYASPLLASRSGGHGYDIVDPTRLDPRLGTPGDFEAFWRALAAHRMGVVLDVVPNHLAADPDENRAWRSVLALGRTSPFASWFDVVWNDPKTEGRVLLPVLPAPLAEAIAAAMVRMERDADDEVVVRLGHQTFPTAPGSVSSRDARAAARDPDAFADVLERQHYVLAYWREGNAHVNYRRFFDLPWLVAVRQEDPAVFEATHALVFDLVRRGRVDGVPVGLRVDHVDGLADPDTYLRRVAEATGAYVVVEKILTGREELPDGWPVAGDSGYAFMDAVDGSCVAPGAPERMDRATHAVGMDPMPAFVRTARDAKRVVIAQLFGAELDRLVRLASGVIVPERTRPFTADDVRIAIVELTVALPVYRTYLRTGAPVRPFDARLLRDAAREALAAGPRSIRPVIDAVHRTLMSAPMSSGDGGEFIRRWQQFCVAVAAKGVEDTALYRDLRVPSRNEVGADPGHPAIGVAGFHRRMARRSRRWPGALSASSTHDSKRSGDARARLHVLTEMPDAWAERVERWTAWNRPHRRLVGGRPAPSPLDELVVYEALVAIWPMASPVSGADDRLVERLQRHAVKAAREAKVDTDWLDPDRAYEDALVGFVAGILRARRGRFVRDVSAFVRTLAPWGALGSLAATVLQVAAPGVPDIYQGTETWSLQLVDPDNRGPVDLGEPRAALTALDAQAGHAADPDVLARLVETYEDGRLKLYVLSRSLRLRDANRDLFRAGRYLPIEADGRHRGHVVAFARRRRDRWAIAAVPRLAASVIGASGGPPWPVGSASWGRTALVLPPGAPQRWRDAFSGSIVRVRTRDGAPVLRLQDLFATLPVTLLEPDPA